MDILKQVMDASDEELDSMFSSVVGVSKEVLETELTKLNIQIKQVAATIPEKGPKGDKGDTGGRGLDGLNGKDGRNGFDGRDGKDGVDGKQGDEGKDGISVVNAYLDFDNSLVMELSDGTQLDVGQFNTPEALTNIIQTLKQSIDYDLTKATGVLPVINGGTGVSTSTGTGNVVLSESPTFTGTLNAAAISATGTGAFGGSIAATASSALSVEGVFTNNSAGVSSSAGVRGQANSTGAWLLRQYSTGVTATVFGQTLANYALLASQGASSNGLMLGSLTAAPVIFGTNNVERARIHSSGGVSIGNTTDAGAGNLSVTGTISTSADATVNGLRVGKGVGSGNASNTAVGLEALNSNTTGDANSAIGYRALKNNNTGFYNTAVGAQALLNNSTGVANNAFGLNALSANTTGGSNCAVGFGTLGANTTGNNNMAIGSGALATSTTASGNVGVGINALNKNTSGTGNVSIGNSGLFANTTGGYNVAIGSEALNSMLTGSFNIGIGEQAGRFTQTGTANTASSYSTYIGYRARSSSDTAVNEVVISGEQATGLGSNTTVIGTSATTQARVFGALTANSFIPTSSTVPTNGVYLPATNAVAIATNSTARMQIGATGGVSIGNTTDPGNTNLSVTGAVSLASLFGVSYPQTSTGIGTSIIDTGIAIPTGGSVSMAYIAVFSANANVGGNPAYRGNGIYLINISSDFAGGSQVYQIKQTKLSFGVSGPFSIELTLAASSWDGTTDTTTPLWTSASQQLRIKIAGFTGVVGTNLNFRLIKLL